MRSTPSLIQRVTTDISNIQQLGLFEICRVIDFADQQYYREGHESPLTDEEYDALRAELKNLNPGNVRLTRVGIPYSPEELRNKIEHPIPMGSLDNTDDGILGYPKWSTWLSDKLGVANPAVVASLKIDGASIRLRYVEGQLVEAVTRGNGEVGENITANVANFVDVPTVLKRPMNIDVRGEAILYISDYQDIVSRDAGCPFDQIPEKERSNPRNLGNGILGRDNGQDSDKMRFVAFNIECDTLFETELNKLWLMKDLGFQPVPHKLCNTDEELEAFYSSTADGRSKLPFEIDGVVVIANRIEHQQHFVTNDPKTRLRPKYARAIKFPHKSNTTTIIGVDLTVGHSGIIAPTAILEEVRIGGVNVTHALLNNWEEIARLDCAIGDTVEVVLAGDIIPKVIRTVTKGANRTPLTEPTHCPSCGDTTTRMLRGKSGAATFCSNSNCPEVAIRKIDRWIGTSKKGTGILGIGDTILRALWDEQIVNDAADLYTMTVDQIKDLELSGGGRIGESRATEIVANVAGKKHLTLEVFLGSLGIELLGRRRVIILREAANGELDALEDWLDDQKLTTIEMEGFGDSIREAVRHGLKECRPLIDKLLANGVTIDYPIVEEVADDTDLPFAGMTFCLTGTRECEGDIPRLGGTMKSSVAKSKPSPDFLVQKDPLSTSNKTRNAEANGHTQIIALDYLKRAIAGEVELTLPEVVTA